MNYNDGKWHGWNGGKCPVHPETVVECARDDGPPVRGAAGGWYWDDEKTFIVAFRVIKEHKEPREFWVSGGQTFSSNFDAEQDAKMFGFDEIIHVREVLE